MSEYIWKRPDLPRKGWLIQYTYDHETPDFVCEFCENHEVRYVHVMSHPDVAETIQVGCICAGHMMEDYITPQKALADFHKSQRKAKRDAKQEEKRRLELKRQLAQEKERQAIWEAQEQQKKAALAERLKRDKEQSQAQLAAYKERMEKLPHHLTITKRGSYILVQNGKIVATIYQKEHHSPWQWVYNGEYCNKQYQTPRLAEIDLMHHIQHPSEPLPSDLKPEWICPY